MFLFVVFPRFDLNHTSSIFKPERSIIKDTQTVVVCYLVNLVLKLEEYYMVEQIFGFYL